MPASTWAPHLTAGVGCLAPFPWTASGLRRMEGCRVGFGEPRPPSTHRAAPVLGPLHASGSHWRCAREGAWAGPRGPQKAPEGSGIKSEQKPACGQINALCPPQPSTSRPLPSTLAPLTAPPLLVPPGSPGHREATRWLPEVFTSYRNPQQAPSLLGPGEAPVPGLPQWTLGPHVGLCLLFCSLPLLISGAPPAVGAL